MAFFNSDMPTTRRLRVIDVERDGNCIPRSLALGLGLSQTQYASIKFTLIQELRTHREFYENLPQIAEGDVGGAITICGGDDIPLIPDGGAVPEGYAKRAIKICRKANEWLNEVHMLAFSNAFNVILCVHTQSDPETSLTAAPSTTFIPIRLLSETPSADIPERVVHIALSNHDTRNHFIALRGDDIPIPQDIHSASLLADHFQGLVERFNEWVSSRARYSNMNTMSREIPPSPQSRAARPSPPPPSCRPTLRPPPSQKRRAVPRKSTSIKKGATTKKFPPKFDIALIICKHDALNEFFLEENDVKKLYSELVRNPYVKMPLKPYFWRSDVILVSERKHGLLPITFGTTKKETKKTEKSTKQKKIQKKKTALSTKQVKEKMPSAKQGRRTPKTPLLTRKT